VRGLRAALVGGAVVRKRGVANVGHVQRQTEAQHHKLAADSRTQPPGRSEARDREARAAAHNGASRDRSPSQKSANRSAGIFRGIFFLLFGRLSGRMSRLDGGLSHAQSVHGRYDGGPCRIS
jgi:hypothetical protein